MHIYKFMQEIIDNNLGQEGFLAYFQNWYDQLVEFIIWQTYIII